MKNSAFEIIYAFKKRPPFQIIKQRKHPPKRKHEGTCLAHACSKFLVNNCLQFTFSETVVVNMTLALDPLEFERFVVSVLNLTPALANHGTLNP